MTIPQVLHVVRDGRDMAYSHNRAPITKYAPHLHLQSLLLPPPPPPSDPEISCAAWAVQNMEALRWGERWSKHYHHHHGPSGGRSGSGAISLSSSNSVGNKPSSSSPSALPRSLLSSASSGEPRDYQKDGEDEGKASANGVKVVEHYRWRRIEDFNASDPAGLALWVDAVMEVQGGPRGGMAYEVAAAAVQQHMYALNGKSLGSHDPSVRAANKLAQADSSSAAASSINTPPSKPPSVGGYGKWRTLADPATQKKLETVAQEALVQFGYL